MIFSDILNPTELINPLLDSKVRVGKGGGSQMVQFCLLVEFHRMGLLPTGLPYLVVSDPIILSFIDPKKFLHKLINPVYGKSMNLTAVQLVYNPFIQFVSKTQLYFQLQLSLQQSDGASGTSFLHPMIRDTYN